MLRVIQSFEARWTNYGDDEPTVRRFEAGEQYRIQAHRPEGVTVDGFFLFNKYLKFCEITEGY